MTKSDKDKGTTRVAAPAQVDVPFVPKKLISFDQWAAQRGIKKHHKGGLRAFIRNSDVSRSLEDWDNCFKNY